MIQPDAVFLSDNKVATRKYHIEGLGEVALYKRKGMRTLKLSVTSQGQVRVSLPPWLPYKVGLNFAAQKRDWILSRRPEQVVLRQFDLIGPGLRLVFYKDARLLKPRTRVTATEIRVALPADTAVEHDESQAAARKACLRVLKRETEDNVIPRLKELARTHGFEYRSVNVKALTGRWGSCNHQKDIVLSCFLAQLPAYEIDYVLLHELTHTRILAHGPRFWAELSKYVPRLQDTRKSMRAHRPEVMPNIKNRGGSDVA